MSPSPISKNESQSGHGRTHLTSLGPGSNLGAAKIQFIIFYGFLHQNEIKILPFSCYLSYRSWLFKRKIWKISTKKASTVFSRISLYSASLHFPLVSLWTTLRKWAPFILSQLSYSDTPQYGIVSELFSCGWRSWSFWTADSHSPGQIIYTTSQKGLVVKNMAKTLRTDSTNNTLEDAFPLFWDQDARLEHVP